MKKMTIIFGLSVLLLGNHVSYSLAEAVSSWDERISEEEQVAPTVQSELSTTELEINTQQSEESEASSEGIKEQDETEQPIEEPESIVEYGPIEELMPAQNQTRDVFDEVNATNVAKDKIKPVIESGLNSSYTKEKLGYKQGDSISWQVTAEMSHIGTDMMGAETNLRYTGTTELGTDIVKTSSDGTIRFNYNKNSKTASLTRLKNAPTTLENSNGLTYSYQAKYAFVTYKKVMFWVKVEDRFGEFSQEAKLNNISLAVPPKLIVESKAPTIELEKEEAVPDTPENFLNVTQRMDGGTLVYEWLKKPDTSTEGSQTGRVRVTDTLGSYKNVSELDLTFIVEEPGSITLEVPEVLAFEDYQVNGVDAIVSRQVAGWSLVVKDTRKPVAGEQQSWTLTAKAVSSGTGLEDYLYFVDGSGSHSLLETTTIYEKGEDAQTTINWAKDQGVLLKIPAQNKLNKEKSYQTSIIWNINEGP